jgi:endonuclease I
MKRIFLALLVLIISIGAVTAQNFIEPCKYGQPLINAVRIAYKPNSTLGYNNGRDILYSEIDNVGNDLFGIYTNFKVTLDPNADPSISAFQNGVGINAEHVYPQSKGAGSEPMKSDLHNIYPSKVSVNSARGSCRFAEIPDANTDTWYFESTAQGNIPTSNIDSYSEKDAGSCLFEPRESKKGDIARAVFYFYAIYQTQANSADANFFNNQKDDLLAWHYADLPDSIELARSSEIAARQGNENPFALDTSLARRAFFMADATYPAGDGNCYDVLISNTDELVKNDWIKLRTNVIQNVVQLESTRNEGSIQVFDLTGRILMNTVLDYNNQLNVSDLNPGFYVVRVFSGGESAVFRILKI